MKKSHLLYSLFVVPLIFWANTTVAAPFTGEVKILDPGGTNIFQPPQPISGDLDISNNTMTVDPFIFLGTQWITQQVELLGEGTHTRPDGFGGTISATVGPGQLGAYITINWSVNTFPTFMVWDVASNANGAVYTTIDSDGDGIPGHSLTSQPFPGFSVVYDYFVGGPPPGIEISIAVDGGTNQECAETGGSVVSLTATVALVGGAEPGSIDWFVDGEDAGSGETITPFLALGAHTVEALATAKTGESDTDSVPVTVHDTTPPDLDVAFINKAGDPITSVRSKSHVTARISPSDICDPDPVAEGSAVPVFEVADGDTIKIKPGKISTVKLPTTAIELSGSATDSSGNSVTGMAVLSIVN